jgi:hypothetical protein
LAKYKRGQRVRLLEDRYFFKVGSIGVVLDDLLYPDTYRVDFAVFNNSAYVKYTQGVQIVHAEHIESAEYTKSPLWILMNGEL